MNSFFLAVNETEKSESQKKEDGSIIVLPNGEVIVKKNDKWYPVIVTPKGNILILKMPYDLTIGRTPDAEKNGEMLKRIKEHQEKIEKQIKNKLPKLNENLNN